MQLQIKYYIRYATIILDIHRNRNYLYVVHIYKYKIMIEQLMKELTMFMFVSDQNSVAIKSNIIYI